MSFTSSFIERSVEIKTYQNWLSKYQNIIRENPSFLASFPRSGNGWVRLVLAATILELNRIDINQVNITRKQTINGVSYISLETKKHSYDLEDIIPDMYLLNQRTKENYSTFDLMTNLIKTHNIIDCSLHRTIFLFREPLKCLTSASLLLNGQAIKQNHQAINSSIVYLAKFYNRILEHYLIQKEKYPDNCFFLSNRGMNEQQMMLSFKKALRFLGIDADIKLINKVLTKFPLRSGYDKSVAQYIDDNTKKHLQDLIGNKYDKAKKIFVAQ
ncbi:MAG: hypothetical protein AAF652_09550 [Cyanobacteria bacterium P01_C01_bin.72]